MDYRRLIFISVSLIVLAAGVHDLMIYFGVEEEQRQEHQHLDIDYEMNGSWFTDLERSEDITHYSPENKSVVYLNEDSNEVLFVHRIDFRSIREEDYREEYTVRMAVADTYLEDINDFEVYQVNSNDLSDTGHYVRAYSLSVEEIKALGRGEEVLFRTAVSGTGENPEFFGTHSTVFLLQRELVFDRNYMEEPGFRNIFRSRGYFQAVL